MFVVVSVRFLLSPFDLPGSLGFVGEPVLGVRKRGVGVT